MATLPISFTTNTFGNAPGTQSHIATFLKSPSAPGGDTTVLDLNFGAPGYLRLKLTSTLHLVYEWSLLGHTVTLDINNGVAIAPGSWYWAELWMQAGDSGGTNLSAGLASSCIGPGGSGYNLGTRFCAGWCGNAGYDGTGTYVLNAQFGLGASVSSGYASWPNTSGWELSKAVIKNKAAGFASVGSSGGSIGVPSADYVTPSADSSLVGYWPCSQAIGATAALADASANAHTLSGTMTINADGPY